MSIFTPRTTDEILQALMARVQARTGLDDVRESGQLLQILASISEEFSTIDYRLQVMINAFAFDESLDGKDLDDRAAQLPGISPPARLPPSAATGNVLKVFRGGDTAVPMLLPSGSLFGRNDGVNVTYRTTADHTFGVGIDMIYPVELIATSTGLDGNCEPDAITTIVSAPKDVIAATNVDPLNNGMPSESDALFRARCLLYLGSLSGCQPLALQYAALSFLSTGGQRVRYARIFEDPIRKGYSELVVDDGSGLAGSSKAGTATQGFVPASGVKVLWHEAPATAPIAKVRLDELDPFGMIVSTKTYNASAPKKTVFTSLPERGVVFFPPGELTPGWRWTIEDYDVFVGLIQELQKFLDGDPSDPTTTPGKVAAGTSVRVVPPTVDTIGMALAITPYEGISYDAVAATAITNAVNFCAGLGPGETFYVSQLECYLLDMDPTRLKSVMAFKWTGGFTLADLVRLEDINPIDLRHVFRTTSTKIKTIQGA